MRLAAKLKLSSQYVEENRDHPVLLRNVCVVFGCLAEKMAGPNSMVLLTDDTLAFLLDILVSGRLDILASEHFDIFGEWTYRYSGV